MTPGLSHKDELTLAKRSAACDTHARRQLIAANLRLVIVIAITRHYIASSVPLIDLIRQPRADAGASSDAEPTRVRQGIWEMINRMERHIDRLSRFIDEMLDLSCLEAGKPDLAVERCDLVTTVGEAVSDQHLISPSGRIVYDPTEGVTAPVLVDARCVGHVVTNYLTNALKYAPGDRPVNVWVEIGATEARVCVRDEGPGLPAADQERIWRHFQQVEGIQRQSGAQSGIEAGLDLGLYVSRTIVEPYRGEVGIESTPGEGATFWCALPLASTSAEDSQTPPDLA